MQYRINGDYLVAELKKRGMTMAEASRKIGHASNYLAKAAKAGRVEEHVLRLLESMFNIKETDLTDKENDSLEDTIYRAVLRALIEAKMGV